MRPKRWAIFISGTGSNLNAALEMRDHIDIALVVSSRQKALGILKAKRAGIPVVVLDKNIHWMTLDSTLRKHGVERIFLLGFMKLLSVDFVAKWTGRIVNIHPSLLPSYPGLESLRKSFEDKSKMGVSVHEVTAEMDAGPILLKRQVGRGRSQFFENYQETEFEIHRNEHRMVREVLAQWNRVATS